MPYYPENYRLLVEPASDGESNEVTVARMFLRAYDRLGISDEMSWRDIDLINELQPGFEAAIEVLRARDLLL